jgi:hypothetical protein
MISQKNLASFLRAKNVKYNKPSSFFKVSADFSIDNTLYQSFFFKKQNEEEEDNS